MGGKAKAAPTGML